MAVKTQYRLKLICYVPPQSYELIAKEPGAPQISLHAQPFQAYMAHINAGDWEGVAGLMLDSARKLCGIGAEFLIAPCNTIHQALGGLIPVSPLPWLSIAASVVSEAKRAGYRRVSVLGSRLTMESVREHGGRTAAEVLDVLPKPQSMMPN